MRPPPVPFAADADLAGAAVRARLADLRELLKPGISAFVVVTAATGYLLGAPAVDWPTLLGLLLGTALTAGGSGALNHLLERGPDAHMRRTQDRPLPAGRVRPAFVLGYGLALVAAGLAVLAPTTNAVTTGLAFATVVLYLGVYTPLKRRTVLNTFVGAVPGALPALGGFTAATGVLGPVGFAAFGILFLWQLPHFYALAWMLRADYARGGFVMLPSQPNGERATATVALAATLLLLVVGVLPGALGATGWLYLAGMAALGTAFTLPAFAFFAGPSDRRARRLLLASIAYVPAFFGLVVLDALLR